YFCTMSLLLFTLRRTIGKLDLFKAPGEVLQVIWELGIGPYYVRWIIWKEENLFSFNIAYNLRRQIMRIGVFIAVFIAGVIGVFMNSLYALRAAFGSLIMLFFLRYPYALLIAWALIGTFIGSSLSIFS